MVFVLIMFLIMSHEKAFYLFLLTFGISFSKAKEKQLPNILFNGRRSWLW